MGPDDGFVFYGLEAKHTRLVPFIAGLIGSRCSAHQPHLWHEQTTQTLAQLRDDIRRRILVLPVRGSLKKRGLPQLAPIRRP